MKKVPSAPAVPAEKRSKSLRPKFGPDPVPQPVGRRFGLPMRRAGVRRKPLFSWRAPKGPFAFVFVRASKVTPVPVVEAGPPARRKTSPKPPAKTPSVAAAPSVPPAALAQPAVQLFDAVRPAAKPVFVPVPAPIVAFRETLSPSLRPPPVPAILLEGDAPSDLARTIANPVAPAAEVKGRTRTRSGDAAAARSVVIPDFPKVTGPRPASAPTAASTPAPPRAGVWLSARDSHCLLLGWNVDRAWLRAYVDAFPGGVWEWRLHAVSAVGPVVASGTLPADCDFQFAPVAVAGASYCGEVGFRHADGGWMSIGISLPAATPAVPPPVRSEQAASAPSHFQRVAPVAPRRAPGFASGARPVSGGGFQFVSHAVSSGGGDAGHEFPAMISDEAFEEILWTGTAIRAAGGSSEAMTVETITGRDVLRVKRPVVGNAGPADIAADQPSSAELAPAGEAPPPPGFWFKVNAELVIHGSTEPDARVTIAGRPVRLRPDGSFTFRFSLPDGEFSLPVLAVSARGDDGRAAELTFQRRTGITGLVDVHPIDPALLPPVPETIG